MKFANRVNVLVKFVRLDFEEEKKAEMMVMERLYPVNYRAFELKKRELVGSV